jgi:hypothetical protein
LTTDDRFTDKLAALSSGSTQPTIQVEDAVVCETVGRQKQSGISNLCRIRYSIERRIFEVSLLEFWLEI